MKNPWIIIGVVCVVLFGGAIWYSGKSAAQNNAGIEVQAHITGDAASTITLTEYSDFQCPACASFQPALKEVLGQYGDQIRFEYKHFPLSNIHPHALAAAVAAEAAGQQGKFFEFHDLLFANQQEWASASIPTTYFLQFAEELGLDLDLFRKHMNSSVLRDRVRADFNEGLTLQVTGTPTFFLNGQKMQPESYQQFVDQIAAAVDPSAVASTTEPTGPSVQFGL